MVLAKQPGSDGAEGVDKVLVVDDDPDINGLLQARLKARGYQVDSAINGEEALERLSVSQPDLIFLDISMPGIDGLEVLEHVRARALDIAVIMTTAFGSEKVAIEALRRGADDYLRKPFEPAEFRAVLQRTVDRLALSRQNTALRRELDEKRLQLETELAHAAEVQAELFPRAVPVLDGFELAARFLPAREVGGDFYDWYQPASGELSVTLGDISGKGMPAAIMMATVRAAMRAVAQQNLPAEAMRRIMLALGDDLERANRYVTLFLARLDVAAKRLRYVDAGHGHVFLRRADGMVEGLPVRGLPLGLLPDETYQEGILMFREGDALIVYSDGLIDARPELDLDPSALAAQLSGAASATEMVSRLAATATDMKALPDDLTVLALRCSMRQ